MWEGIKTFDKRGQEETFVRFTIEKDGTVKDSSIRYLKKNMVSPAIGHHSTSPPPAVNNTVETFIGSDGEDDEGTSAAYEEVYEEADSPTDTDIGIGGP